MENYTENIETITETPIKNRVCISKEDFYGIWDRCCNIKNNAIRARMVTNLIAAIGSKKILKENDIIVSDTYSMQNISAILNKWDISEIYVGECKISVRYCFGEYKPFIPRKQDKYGMLGDVFMFVYIDNNTVELLGFLPYEKLNKTYADADNYYIIPDELQTIEEIKPYFNINKEIEDIDNIKKERVKIVEFYDGTLEDKIEFFKILSRSKYLREEMIKYENAHKYFNKIIEKESDIKAEIEEEVNNISRLADAFIQSKNAILEASTTSSQSQDSQSFKIECARANLERLFNSATEPVREEFDKAVKDITYQTTDEVMDSLLDKSGDIVLEDTSKNSPVLKIIKIIGLLILIAFISIGIICFINDSKYYRSNIIAPYKYTFETLINKYIK